MRRSPGAACGPRQTSRMRLVSVGACADGGDGTCAVPQAGQRPACATNRASQSLPLARHVRRELAPGDRELVDLVGPVRQAQGAQVRVSPGEGVVV